MSGLAGTTKKINTTPQPTDQLRSGVVDYLMGGQRVNNGGGGSPFDQIQAQTGYMPERTTVGMAGPVNTQYNAGDSFSRGMVRDVSSAPTQSVDSLGGANSPFFQNMMRQLSPAFDMRRKLALADATERAGNLTGSGFANALGNTVNRSLGDEQATLANYASQGVQTEVGRQSADANRALTAGTSNQGADQTFINQLLQRNAQGLTAQQMGLTAEMSNQQNARDTYAQQAGIDSANQTLAAQLDAQRRDANAGRYAGLLGQQAGAGVSPDTIQQSGGIGALLAPILGGLGTGIGSGNVNIGSILSHLGIGGGGQSSTSSDAGGQLSGLLGQIFGGGPSGNMVPGVGIGGPSINPFMLGDGAGVGITPWSGQSGQPITGANGLLGQILNKGNLGTALAGGINLGGHGPLINAGNAGGAVAGKAIGSVLGSLIPIPGVGTALGGLAGSALSKPIGKAVSGIGKGIKKIFSDETLKDNIRPMGDGLDVIRSLEPVRFDYKRGWGDKDQVGFLAQQLQKSIPEAVSRDKRSGKLMIRPDFVIPHLVVATKQLDARLGRMY